MEKDQIIENLNKKVQEYEQFIKEIWRSLSKSRTI